MTRRTPVLFLASLCLAATAAFATSDAAARWTRTTPWACHIIQGAAIDSNWALQNNSTGSELIALCPILDTDYLPKQDLDTVNVHVRDGNANGSARAHLCEGNFVTAGGACSGPASSGLGFVGNATLSPNTNAVWSGATFAYFGYVYVAIPPRVGGSRSNIRGYYTSD